MVRLDAVEVVAKWCKGGVIAHKDGAGTGKRAHEQGRTYSHTNEGE